MDAKEELLERIQEKIANIGKDIGIESKYLIDNDRGEIYIAIRSALRMGKLHKNVRETIRVRVRKSRLRHYTIFLHLNPIEPGRACMTWALHPKANNWVVETVRRLPAEELVA